jgi:transcriptional regulator with XRE-family HTH domain
MQTHVGEEPTEPEAQPVLLEQRQRISPAIQQLCQQRRLSLVELAQQTGSAVSYLARLEESRTIPTFTLLYRLAQNLGVDIGYFVETEQRARNVADQLVWELGHTAIPQRVWPELLGMSLEARKAIADHLRPHVSA